MTQNIVQCDQCRTVVQVPAAHGWLEVKTWITQPSHQEFELMRANPTLNANLRVAMAAGKIQPMDPPELLGGDFCGVGCLVTWARENELMLDAFGVQERTSKEPPRPARHEYEGEWTAAPEPPEDYQQDDPPAAEEPDEPTGWAGGAPF